MRLELRPTIAQSACELKERCAPLTIATKRVLDHQIFNWRFQVCLIRLRDCPALRCPRMKSQGPRPAYHGRLRLAWPGTSLTLNKHSARIRRPLRKPQI